MALISSLGKYGVKKFTYLMDLSALFWRAVLLFFRSNGQSRSVILKDAVKQVLFTGVQAMPVITVVSALLGLVIIIQAYTLLPALGGAEVVSSLLVLVIVRELGPILTAFIIIGRSGTAICTELGNMKVSNEILALKSMGIDPIRYIVTPRLFGMVISMILLGIYFNIIGIFGGFLVAQLQIDVPMSAFGVNLLNVLKVEDIYISIVKNAFSGIAIVVVSCYYGMQVQLSSTEVPQMTTKSVVSAIFFCFFFNAVFTVAFYM